MSPNAMQLTGMLMCNRCDELDKMVEKYKSTKRSVIDQQTLDAIDELVKKLQIEKTGPHTE